MKKKRISLRTIVIAAVFCIAALAQRAVAQTTTVYNASYDATGGLRSAANANNGPFNLAPFTVTGVYVYTAATTQVTVYITDGTSNGRVFSTSAFTTLPTIGAQYTSTVSATPFQATQELSSPTTFVATGIMSAVTPVSTTVGAISSTSHIAASPSDTAYASTAALLFAPVTFTIVPTTSGTLSTTTSTNIIDGPSGLTVTFFRSPNALPYNAGQMYTATGYEQPFTNNGVLAGEIVGTTALNAVPEPSATALLGLGSALAFVVVLRSRRTSRTGA